MKKINQHINKSTIQAKAIIADRKTSPYEYLLSSQTEWITAWTMPSPHTQQNITRRLKYLASPNIYVSKS